MAQDLLFRFRCFKYLILIVHLQKNFLLPHSHEIINTKELISICFSCLYTVFISFFIYRRHRLNEELSYSMVPVYTWKQSELSSKSAFFKMRKKFLILILKLVSDKLILLVHQKSGSLQISNALYDVLSY